MDAVVAGEGHAARRPVSSTTRVTVPTGLRLPEAGWRKTFQQKVKASESTFLAYAAPTSRSNRLPPGVPGAAFVALNVTAPPAVVAAARREAIAATAARRLIINYHRHLAGRLRRL